MSQPPKKLELSIDALAKGGDGVARLDGKVYFIRGALPGERVTAEILQDKKSFGRGKVLEILQRSPLRAEENCAAFQKGCDSCGFRHVRPEVAFKLKSEALSREIFKIAHLNPIEPNYYPVSAANGSLDGMRQRVRLHLKNGRIGYFARDSHTIVPAESCAVIAPELRNIIRFLKTIKPSDSVFSCDLQIDLDDQDRPFIHIKPAEFDTSGRHSFPKPSTWLHKMIQSGLFAGIRFADEPVAGEAMIRDTVVIPEYPDIFYWRRIGDFAQATRQGNAQLHSIVADFLRQTKPRTLADLFAGSGNLTFRAAQFVPTVHAFEFFCDPEAFETGVTCNSKNWSADTHVRLHLCDLTKGLPRMAASCEAVICDPAREGLSEKMCHDLKASAIQHVLYISCEATNLARDLARISHTFDIRSLAFVDMFPCTPHVETVVLLSRK